MRIGIMLRHVSQHGGGVMVYTESLLRTLFDHETEHEFLLMYRDRRLLGTYANKSNVTEVAMWSASKLGWDQIAVTRIEKREKVDLIFNPKYSLPLRAKCPTVFVSHGLDWYVMPWGSKWVDRLSHRYLIPRYAKKATRIIAVSDTTREHVIKYLDVDEERVSTVYLGVDETFRQPVSDHDKEVVRKKYRLPEQYFLYVGQIYPPKNFGRLLQAYAKVGPELGHHLVVAGTHTWLCEEELNLIEQLGLESWILRPGWIGRETLPAFYAQAKALLLPSLYEACPSPPIEAMASGCPVLTSNRYGTKEITQNAGILVDPEDVDSIADGMRRLATDDALRKDLVQRGYARSRDFSWGRCARATLDVLESAMGE